MNTYSNGTNVNACMPCQSGTSTQGQTGQTTESSCGKTYFFTSSSKSEEIIGKLDLHVCLCSIHFLLLYTS